MFPISELQKNQESLSEIYLSINYIINLRSKTSFRKEKKLERFFKNKIEMHTFYSLKLCILDLYMIVHLSGDISE